MEPVNEEMHDNLEEAFLKDETTQIISKLAYPSSQDVEGLISKESLEFLQTNFERFDLNHNGQLDLQEFYLAMDESVGYQLNRDILESLFCMIDISGDGEIGWDELARFILKGLSEKHLSRQRDNQVDLVLPARKPFMPHKATVSRVRMSHRTMMSMGDDAVLAFWASSSNLSQMKKPVNLDLGIDGSPFGRQKPKWATDFALLPETHLVCVSSGERELYFYDSGTYDPFFVITQLEATPLRVASCYDKSTNAQTLIYGDEQGFLGCVIMPLYFQNSASFSTARFNRQLLKIPFNDLLRAGKQYGELETRRWKVHNDWITELSWNPHIRQIISSSVDRSASMVVGQIIHPILDVPTTFESKVIKKESSNSEFRTNDNQLVFRVRKGGIRTFDFCHAACVIATGGLDRLIRLWNPFSATRPTGILHGHNSPIASLCVQEHHTRLFSLDTSSMIKIWHLVEQTCIYTISDHSHKIPWPIELLFVNLHSNDLVLFGEAVGAIQMKRNDETRCTSHSHPVSCSVFNPRFGHIITACKGGIIKVWDSHTGRKLNEFTASEADGIVAFTTMTMDDTGIKLITADINGKMAIYNYNNGNKIRDLQERSPNEVSKIIYTKNKSICTVWTAGWSRKVNAFQDINSGHVDAFFPINDGWHTKTGSSKNPEHYDDILCMAICEPSLLASGDYAGDILLWNMVSGVVLSRLSAHKAFTRGVTGVVPKNNNSGTSPVFALEFLPSRISVKDAGNLIACSTDGMVYFWCTFMPCHIVAQFKVQRQLRPGLEMYQLAREGPQVADIEVIAVFDNDNSILVSDTRGFVYHYDITNYCTGKGRGLGGAPPGLITEPPPLTRSWRAHLSSISSLTVFRGRHEGTKQQQYICTASVDLTARLWTIEGVFIGILNQPLLWDLLSPEEFHGGIPSDIEEYYSSLESLQSQDNIDLKEKAGGGRARRSSTAWGFDEAILAEIDLERRSSHHAPNMAMGDKDHSSLGRGGMVPLSGSPPPPVSPTRNVSTLMEESELDEESKPDGETSLPDDAVSPSSFPILPEIGSGGKSGKPPMLKSQSMILPRNSLSHLRLPEVRRGVSFSKLDAAPEPVLGTWRRYQHTQPEKFNTDNIYRNLSTEVLEAIVQVAAPEAAKYRPSDILRDPDEPLPKQGVKKRQSRASVGM